MNHSETVDLYYFVYPMLEVDKATVESMRRILDVVFCDWNALILYNYELFSFLQIGRIIRNSNFANRMEIKLLRLIVSIALLKHL